MSRRALLVVVVSSLVAGGCSLDGSLAQYCERTGDCACTDGDCCTTEDAPCSDAWGCCHGLVCEESRCVLRDPPVLEFLPDSVDLGRTTPLGTTGESVMVLLRNNGQGATRDRLELSVTGDVAAFVVDTAGCQDRLLAAGAECRLPLAARPHAFGTFRIEISASSGRYRASVLVQYATGANVSVSLDGGGVATITSAPPGIACPPDCTGTFDDGQVLSLTAEVAAGSEFRGFGVPGCDGGPACSFRLDGGANVQAVVEPWLELQVKQPVAFRNSRLEVDGQACQDNCRLAVAGPVTVEAYAGGWTGLQAWTGACADAGLAATCTVDVTGPTVLGATFAEANQVSVKYVYPSMLGPNFLATMDTSCGTGKAAWLTGPEGTARMVQRLGTARGWVNLEGRPLANTVEELLQGQLFEPVHPRAPYPLAATGGVGVGPAGEDCLDWTTADAGYIGGLPYAAGTSWAEAPGVRGDCSSYMVVYCFDSSRQVRVRPRSLKTRVAFLSSPWRPGGGVDAADRHCTEEAQAHGLAGTYLAALEAPGRGPDPRRSNLTEHRRVDHVELALGPPLNVRADGGYQSVSLDADAGTFAWTGDAIAHCADWTATTGAGRVGRPDLPRDLGGLSDRPLPCDTAQRLYCLQQ